MSKIEQEIFKSIQTIAKRLIDKSGFDKTIQGSVIGVPDEDSDNEFYIVQHENAQYRAKYTGQEEISIGDVVFMLIPGGNTANTKYILGTV